MRHYLRLYQDQRRLSYLRDAPPILFRLAEKECAAPGGRKRRWGRKLDPLWGQVWAKTRGPSKRPWEVESASSLGAGSDLLRLSALGPRRKCSRAPGCKTDLTCVFPPLPLCPSRTSQRLAKRKARKETLVKSDNHPESRTHTPNCGEALLCSHRPKRTR